MFTDADSNVGGRLGAKWCGTLGIYEGMGSTTNSALESKTESSVRVLEKDGHLQLCILDMLSSIGNGVGNPQDLGDHSSNIPDAAVEHARILIGKVDNERTTVRPNTIRCRDGIALENVREVSFSRLGTETKGYVPVHEKL